MIRPVTAGSRTLSPAGRVCTARIRSCWRCRGNSFSNGTTATNKNATPTSGARVITAMEQTAAISNTDGQRRAPRGGESGTVIGEAMSSTVRRGFAPVVRTGADLWVIPSAEPRLRMPTA